MSPTWEYSPQYTSGDQSGVESSSTRKWGVLVLRAAHLKPGTSAAVSGTKDKPPTSMEAPRLPKPGDEGKRSDYWHVIPIPKVSFIRIMLSCSHFGEQDQPFLRSLEWLPECGSAKQQPSYIKGKCWNHQEACNYVS